MQPADLPPDLWNAMCAAGDPLPVRDRRRYHELLAAGIADWQTATPDAVTELITVTRRNVGVACFGRLQRPSVLDVKKRNLRR
jgi:hypothetical protein